MKKTNYFNFWNNYRIIPIRSEKDLIYQVGWSDKNEPLEKSIILEIIKKISDKLDLNQNDKVLDLCCGNGVISNELSKIVNFIVGIDFSRAFLENANVYKKRSNISYFYGDVENFNEIIPHNILENYKNVEVKIIMSFSLGYFDKKNFTALLYKLNKYFYKFKFYITFIPDYDKYKIVFPNRIDQLKFIINDLILKKTKGIGRFWKRKELISILQKFGFETSFDNDIQERPGTDYRFNLLIIKN